MKDFNHVGLIGRLTRDAELKYTGSGFAVSKFSIAVNRSVKRGDSYEDEVSFFDIILWGKMAESLDQYLLKGKQILVDGELRQERWEKDGVNRSRVEVVANHIQLLGGNQNGQSGSNQGSPAARPAARPAQAPAASAPAQSNDDGFVDDIPF